MSLAGRSGQKAQGGAAASVCHRLAPHTGQLQVGVGGGSALGMEPDHTDQAFAPACFSRGGSPRPEALVPTAAVPTGRLWSGKFPTQQLYLKQSIGERAVPRERWRSGASGGGWGRWSPRPPFSQTWQMSRAATAWVVGTHFCFFKAFPGSGKSGYSHGRPMTFCLGLTELDSGDSAECRPGCQVCL